MAFPVLGALAIGAGANIVGNLLQNDANASAANTAYKQSLAAMREQNAFNHQERLETQEYNRQLLREQMMYNDPARQSERLQAAGINPLNSGSVTAGGVSSVPYSSPASGASPASGVFSPSVNPLQDISSYLNVIADLDLKHEQATGLAIDNQTKSRENLARIDGIIADKELKLSSRDLNSKSRDKLSEEIENLKFSRRLIETQIDYQSKVNLKADERFGMEIQALRDQHDESLLRQDAQRLANDIQSKFGYRLSAAQLASLYQGMKESSARIGKMAVDNQYTRAQIAHEFTKQSETIARTIGIKANNQHFKSIVQDIENEMHLQGKRAGYMSELYDDHWYDSFTGKSLFRDIDAYGLGTISSIGRVFK